MTDPDAIQPAFAARFRYRAEAAGFFAAIGLFRLLGIDAASALGGFIGRHGFYRMKSTMDRARDNLSAALPEKTEAEREEIVRDMCDNLGRVVAEYAHLDKLRIDGPDPRVSFSGTEHSDAALARGKGFIFFSGHFANWEVMPFAASRYGYPGAEVYRPINNPYIDRWIVAQRRKNGPASQIAKGARGTRQIFTTLRRGQAVYLLADQKTNEGLPIPFFGREAMTTPAPAMLSLKLGSPLLPASLERQGGARFHIRVHPPIEVARTGDQAQDTYNLTLALTQKLEEIVRARPSQWLWIHRRWPTARAQDQARGKRAAQLLGGTGVRVESEGSSFT